MSIILRPQPIPADARRMETMHGCPVIVAPEGVMDAHLALVAWGDPQRMIPPSYVLLKNFHIEGPRA